jgi:hypothetical protein
MAINLFFLSASKFLSTQRSRRYRNKYAEIIAINNNVVEKEKRWETYDGIFVSDSLTGEYYIYRRVII